MTEPRPTASTINDEQLDQMYAERARAEATLTRVRAAVHIADDEDVTDWQRGYRACSMNALAALDQPTPNLPASTAPLAAGLPLVQGRCPACGYGSLFLGNGGHVTCSIIHCPNPCAADEMLHGSENFSAPWQSQDDGTWTLDIGEGSGALTAPRQTTMRERAQLAAAWTATRGKPTLPPAATAATEPSKEQH